MLNLKNQNPHILVVGDLMCDHYLFGKIERISPEAPVQVVEVKDEKTLLGGAGNVINNLLALGARVSVAKKQVGQQGYRLKFDCYPKR